MKSGSKRDDKFRPNTSVCDVPDIVYKYLSVDGGLASLRKMTIRYSSLSELNDPFECRPQGLLQSDREMLITKALESVQDEEQFRRFCKELHLPHMDELFERRQSVLSGKLNPVRFFTDIMDNASTRIKWHLPMSISERMGIACLSSRYQSILMWSHYASEHKGIVIGYKRRCLGKLLRVTYGKERVSIPFGPDHSKDWVLALAVTKFEEWSYEHEWRSFAWKNQLETSAEGLSVRRIQPKDIAEIYMGLHVDNELKSECESFVHYHPACLLYQSHYHPTQFALKFEKISFPESSKPVSD